MYAKMYKYVSRKYAFNFKANIKKEHILGVTLAS